MTKAEILHLQTQLSDIYRDYRNICLNKKYYAERLRKTLGYNYWYEIFLAAGTSGTVAGWALWQKPGWETVWIVIGAVIALLTAIKPATNLSGEIERLSTLETKFKALQLDFEMLCFDIKTKRGLDKSLIKSYKDIRDKLQTLGVKEDSAVPTEVLRRIQHEVEREIPSTSLWAPK